MPFPNTTSDSGCLYKTEILYCIFIRSLENKITAISNLCIFIVTQLSEASSELIIIYRLNKASIISGGKEIKYYI